jgi:hypothetical protein
METEIPDDFPYAGSAASGTARHTQRAASIQRDVTESRRRRSGAAFSRLARVARRRATADRPERLTMPCRSTTTTLALIGDDKSHWTPA